MAATTSIPRSALGAYKRLLRAAASTFKGDELTLAAAKKEIRQKFEDNRDLGEGKQLDDLLYEAYDAADFIKTHVVQAEMNEKGHYSMSANQSMAEDQPPIGWVEPPPQKCS